MTWHVFTHSGWSPYDFIGSNNNCFFLFIFHDESTWNNLISCQFFQPTLVRGCRRPISVGWTTGKYSCSGIFEDFVIKIQNLISSSFYCFANARYKPGRNEDLIIICQCVHFSQDPMRNLKILTFSGKISISRRIFFFSVEKIWRFRYHNSKSCSIQLLLMNSYLQELYRREKKKYFYHNWKRIYGHYNTNIFWKKIQISCIFFFNLVSPKMYQAVLQVQAQLHIVLM